MGRKRDIINAQADRITELVNGHSEKNVRIQELEAICENQTRSNAEMAKEIRTLTQDRDRCSRAYGQAKAELNLYKDRIRF